MPNLRQLNERMEKNARSKTTAGGGGNVSSTASHHSSQSQADRSFLRKVVYVAPDKELVSLTEHRHKTGGTTIPRAT